MAFSNYTQLQASIAGWLNRDDLVAAIPDFITLAEARFNRELRAREMLTRKTALSNAQYVQLPSDWIEAKNVQIGTRPLKFFPMDDLDELRSQSVTGPTVYYSIIGSSIELLPTPASDVTIEMLYYKTIPALAANETNWLLTKAPDLYLFGALLNAAPYLDNDERAGMWEAFVTKTIEAMNVEAARAAVSGSPLAKSRRTFG